MKKGRKIYRYAFNDSNSVNAPPEFPFIFLTICSLFFTLTFLFPFVSSAQDTAAEFGRNFHRWGSVTLFNGLPSDSVRAVAQTPDGILWFGTDNGLARFDGRRVQTVALENANEIRALRLAADGSLWIGTSRGAFRYAENAFRRIEGTENSAISAIFFDVDIFLATENGAILKLTKVSENSYAVEKIPLETLTATDGQPLKISSFARIKDKIIAGTRSRSILVVENNQTFETFNRPRPFFINALAQDATGNVWFGADSGADASGLFIARDIGNLQRIGNKTGNVSAIEPDGKGGAWVGTGDNGLFHFRGWEQVEHFTFENTAGGLRSNRIYAVFLDREGVLWLGTNRGACRFDSSSPFNETLSENANSNFVRALYRTSDGRVFAGTNRGLFALSDGVWSEAENLAGKVVYSIGEDSGGQLLIASPNGLFDSSGRVQLAGDVRGFTYFRDESYAAVFGRGVIQTKNQNVILANDSPTALCADGDDKLWIGTVRDGVFSFDGKETKRENALESLRGAAIRKIVRGDENNLWLAGERGLFLFRSGGALETIVGGADVRDAAITGVDVWAATIGNGLVHARFDEDFGWLTTALSVEQGLPSEQVFAVLPLENRLLIGTNRGIADYAPSTVPPQIVASRVLSQRLHDMAELKEEIRLDYPQNSLLVEVAGLSSRTFPEQFQYAFTLKNSKGEILDRKLSIDAQYSPANLAAGAYEIEARAFNKDLLSSAPLKIKFSVAREPFPLTAAALGVLLAIALVALVWAMIERRRIAARNRELARARFELTNEAERERRRIARDLHDQTLADLRNLMLMSDKIPADTQGFRSEIESVSTEIRRICEDLSPSVLENVGLTPALEFLLQQTTQNYKFSAAENLEENLNFKPNAQMQIYRIAQEVLNNIKQHSAAKIIEMKLEISAEKEFVLSILNDGKSFNPDKNAAKGRGIVNIKSRAALIEAEAVWAKSETGENVFQLKKPI